MQWRTTNFLIFFDAGEVLEVFENIGKLPVAYALERSVQESCLGIPDWKDIELASQGVCTLATAEVGLSYLIRLRAAPDSSCFLPGLVCSSYCSLSVLTCLGP